jgi:molybdopterin synthase sulfur carrier subunit
MKVKYFAWMKRTVGIAEEEVTPPADVRTVGELVAWLRNRSGGHAEALAEGAAFGAAVDRRTAPFDTKLAGATEVAFFPPFTGG